MGPDNVECRCPHCKSEQLQLIQDEAPYFLCRDCKKRVNLGGLVQLHLHGIALGQSRFMQAVREYNGASERLRERYSPRPNDVEPLKPGPPMFYRREDMVPVTMRELAQNQATVAAMSPAEKEALAKQLEKENPGWCVSIDPDGLVRSWASNVFVTNPVAKK